MKLQLPSFGLCDTPLHRRFCDHACAYVYREWQGSHKSAFPFLELTASGVASLRTMDEETKSLFVEIGGRAGTAIIFTHDLVHCSFNEHGGCRSVLHTACAWLHSACMLSPHTHATYVHACEESLFLSFKVMRMIALCMRVVYGAAADNNAQFTRGWLNAHTNYAALHHRSEVGSWQHYLTRDPDYVDHIERPADASWPSDAHIGRAAKL